MKKEISSRSKSSRSKKGFTLIELMAVIGVMGLLMAVVLIGASSSRKTAQISTTAQQIQLIYSACQAWLGNGRVNYTGISLDTLQQAGYLPSSLLNPYGGTYEVKPHSGDAAKLDIEVANVPDSGTWAEISSAVSNLFTAGAYSQTKSVLTLK